MHTIGTIASAIGLGIVASFSPMLYAGELASLTQSKRPVYQTAVLLAGILTPILIIATLFMLFVNPTQPTPLDGLGDDHFNFRALPWFDIIIGLLLTTAGIVYLIVRRNMAPKRLADKSHFVNNTATLYWFGLTKTLISVSGLAALLLAIKIIKQASPIVLFQFSFLPFLIAGSLLPYGALLLIHLYVPDVFRRIQGGSDRLMHADYHKLLGTILLGIGIYFLALAAWKIVF